MAAIPERPHASREGAGLLVGLSPVEAKTIETAQAVADRLVNFIKSLKI